MFNEYVWKIYLNADGKNIVDLFEKNLSGDLTPSYAKSISALHARTLLVVNHNVQISGSPS